MQTFVDFLTLQNFIPHRYCLNDNNVLLWLHVTADLLLMLAYYSIPLSLVYFVRRRTDLPYKWLITMFMLFIVACGTTHFLSAVVVWLPVYWLEAAVKIFAALISIATAIAMLWIIPNVLQLPSATQLQTEIQERKIMEKKLRSNEESMRLATLLYENSSEAMTVTDGNNIILSVNPAFTRVTGYTLEEAIGKTPTILKSGVQGSDFYKEMWTALNTNGQWHGEIWNKRKNGEIYPEWLSINTIYDELGNPYRRVALFTDMTERKKMEEKLRDSEEYWKFALEGSGDGVWDWDIQTNAVNYSKRYKEMLGYAEHEFQNYAEEWTRHVHPEDLTNVMAASAAHLKNETPTYAYEYRMHCKDGSWKWILDRGMVVNRDNNGKARRMVGTFTDISRRKQIEEEQLQSEKMAALGQLIAGIAHEINTPLGAINSSVGNMRHFLGESLLEMPTVFQNFSAQECSEFIALLSRSLKSDTRLLSTKELRQQRRLLIPLLEEMTDDAETVADTLIDMGIYGNIEDILPLFKQANSPKMLELAYQLSELKKGTQIICTATERASKIVFALKSYTHHDASGRKIKVDIIDGIETILTLYHNLIKQDIELIRHYQPDLPQVSCYPDELNQVWTNLIHNALHAMHNKGKLTIYVSRIETKVKVTIEDSGVGIDPEHKAKIFDAFFTTKPAGEGSGLGLHIIKKIIDKHSGQIEVDSCPGCTAFSVYLPIETS